MRITRSIGSVRRASVAMGLAAALFGAVAPSVAAPTPADVAVAETLFREGKTLLEQGKYADACPKLAESQRIDPGGGTLLLLALCYEADGKTASAWVLFGEALAQAERDQRTDRVKRAREHLARLEKRLSFLTINLVPEAASLEGIELRRDDTTLGKVVFGVAVPVDPGKHRVSAKAPGWKPVTLEVEVGPNGDRKTLEIPALEKEDAPAPGVSLPPPVSPPPAATATSSTSVSLPPRDEPTNQGSGQRTGGLILGGAGIVSVGVGAAFGFMAKSQHDDATGRCPASPCADAEGVRQNEQAQGSALIANVTIGVGLAAIGAGAILWLTAPRGQASSGAVSGRVIAISPVFGRDGAALSVGGTF